MKSCQRILLSLALVAGLFGAVRPAAAEKPKDADCLACHQDPSMTTEVNGKEVSIHVDPEKIKQSIHGQSFQCVDCHTDVKSAEMHATTPKKVECATCHTDEAKKFADSFHARPAKNGAPAAVCADCHGDVHQVVMGIDDKSPVSHAKVAETCGNCHSKDETMKPNGLSAQVFFAFKDSVHGKALAAGNEKSATCTDCHGAHDIDPANMPQSKVTKSRLMETCGQCHTEASTAFKMSVHGQGILKGNSMSPSCTGCHGVHAMKSKNDPSSPTFAGNLSRQTCARCHDGERLSEEFGVPGNRVSSYLDSYHGMAMENGSKNSANCSSCHGVHNILNSTDAQSMTNNANLMKTCGQCHEGVTPKFVATKVHVDPSLMAPVYDLGSLINRWVKWIYIALIICTIGGMALHNIIIWQSKIRSKRRAQMNNPFMTRMTTLQRWQHLTLLVSFIVLVITGFALKFPNTWIGYLFVGKADGEQVRSLLHRIAGVVLMGAGVYHIFYLAMKAEGRRMFRAMLPQVKDGFDAFAAMRYYLGLGGERPRFGRFNYAEKAEYWALVWGTIVMAVTGIMMWAKVTTGNLLARWVVNVATSIHFYEAILATLAILVWHFYMVFLDPDIYPMNWAWFDGKMPVEIYKHEHELDTESLDGVDGADTETDKH